MRQPYQALVQHLTTRLLSFLLAATLVSCASLRPGGPGPAADADYRARLARGWQYLNKRQHSRALAEFSAAGRLRPELAEPVHGRASAVFNLERYAETLAACSELSGESADYFKALGFCWPVRLEIGGGAAASKNAVRAEIEEFLARPSPPDELLYSAYLGYYYLQERELRWSLLLELAEKGAASPLAASVAASLFEEVVEAEPGNARRLELAASYLRNFPEARMAGQAAAIVLRSRQEPAPGGPEEAWQSAQLVLQGKEDHPRLNGAVAHWLLENGTAQAQASRLLRKNLDVLAELRSEPPPLFSPALWQEEVESERLLYKYLLGRAWLDQGETSKAREILGEVTAARPEWPGPHHFLAMAALATGETELAIDSLRTALARGSTRPETTSRLQLLLAERYGFSGEPLAYFQDQAAGTRFQDRTAAAGLAGIKAQRVAWGDYDQDGDDDLLLDGTRLFINRGQNGFVAAPAGLIPLDLPGNGGVWGDYDNDGLLDLFVTNHSGNQLLHNENGIGFTRATAWPGADARPAAGEAAAWGDLNNDGFLDLYVANYEQGAVLRGQCGQDRLYLNRGESVFTESGEAVGMVSEEAMCGRGVLWSDLNDDGWQDILVSNYRLDPNLLWLNRGDGTVVESAEAAGVQGHEVEGAYGHSIGSVGGDLDGDGDLDIFTSNLAHPRYREYSDQSMVLLNNGERLPLFTDRMREAAIPFEETSADPLLFDVDLDGDLDLYVTSIYPNRSSHLYLNDGGAVFTDRTWLAGAGVMNGWGAAAADYDSDGYPDLLVASAEGVRLLHNAGGTNNWLAVRIEDHQCNRFGVGAKVTVSYNGQRRMREITAGRGTGSQDSLTVHFGLGDYTGPVAVAAKTLCGDTLRSQSTELNRVVVLRQ